MKKAYRVTFKWYDSDVYCSNICLAESENEVRKEYNKYSNVIVAEASGYELREAKRRGMPIKEV